MEPKRCFEDQLKKQFNISRIYDGDKSSFKAVVDSKPYEKYNITPTILEWVGHVQKRLGAHL